jgi:D-threo-aldose 1-dehydrogenase
MNTIPIRALGKTGLHVSSLSLGTVPLSGFGGSSTYQDFEDVVLDAYANGIRYMDTAPMYGSTRSEHFLGHILRVKELRKSVVVSTKAGRLMRPHSKAAASGNLVFGVTWIGGLPFVEQFDYSYEGIMRSFEDSQQRLGLDEIDILLVHDIGRVAHGDQNVVYWKQLQDGGFRALDELRRSGVIKAVGVGVNECEAVLEVANEFSIDCCLVAGRYTLIDQQALDVFLPECQRRGIALIAAGVFNSGILGGGSGGATRTYDYQAVPAEIIRKVERLEDACRAFDVALPAAAIQFVAAHPAVTTVLQGAKSVAEIRQNVQALSSPIAPQFWARLKEQGSIPAHAPTPAG